jgi:hypothetical protein
LLIQSCLPLIVEMFDGKVYKLPALFIYRSNLCVGRDKPNK